MAFPTISLSLQVHWVISLTHFFSDTMSFSGHLAAWCSEACRYRQSWQHCFPVLETVVSSAFLHATSRTMDLTVEADQMLWNQNWSLISTVWRHVADPGSVSCSNWWMLIGWKPLIAAWLLRSVQHQKCIIRIQHINPASCTDLLFYDTEVQ